MASVSPLPTEKPARPRNHGVYKSGNLFISSKGLGWKSWKRRWFLLTRTSLVFFKSEPKGPIDGSLALGGIDLNSSGSVHVKAEKRLLTLLFPDGRAFTLKADAAEDLEEWRAALVAALAAAPSAALMVGQPLDAIFRHEKMDEVLDAPGAEVAPGRERRALKSLVVGRPILLALEDIDRNPSFLEKALRYLETYGKNKEGILRESADVEAVERRVREYEQGRAELTEDEDAHVIGDCVKHILRELPSSPVPAPCCTALLLAFRAQDVDVRKSALQLAVADTFPEPNRRLLQRCLKMMNTVAAQESINRMSAAAVSACMAPLLLRPLVAGECIPKHLRAESGGAAGGGGGGDSLQVLAAAQAANQAQNIVVFLMEHYNFIFSDEKIKQRSAMRLFAGDLHWGDDEPEIVEEDDDDSPEDNLGMQLSNIAIDGTKSPLGAPASPLQAGEAKPPTPEGSQGGSPRAARKGERVSPRTISLRGVLSWWEKGYGEEQEGAYGRRGGGSGSMDLTSPPTGSGKSPTESSVDTSQINSPRMSSEERNPADEVQMQVLELTRHDLRSSLSRETRANALLRDSLVSRKAALADRRQSLEQEVTRLRQQLAAEKEAHAALEKGIRAGAPPADLDPNAQADLVEIGTIERDVAGLQSEMGALQRQLDRAQHLQRPPPVIASSSERRHKIEQLLSLKAQLQAELERTMALCLDEQQKNAELEEKRRREDPAALEQAVSQQRAALAEAQAALHAEMARGKELRRRMQAAQKAEALRAFEEKTPQAAQAHDAGTGSEAANGVGAAKEDGSEGAAAADGAPAGPNVALAELSSRLEHFKERRSQLMQQLTALSTDGESAPAPAAGKPVAT